MIEIKNLNIDNYNINTSINEFQNSIIFSDNLKIIKQFSTLISGLNECNSIYYQDDLVYDNELFFKERIYINTSLSYLNTLNEKKIFDYFLNKYEKVFLEDEFKRMVKQLNVRFNIKIKERYYFNNIGTNMCNLILALSIASIRIIYLPFQFISKKDSSYFNQEFLNKKGNILFDDINNINKYSNIYDKIIILFKNKVFEFNANTRILELSNNSKLDIISDYLIYANDDKSFVTLDILKDKELLKELKGMKIKEISLFSIGEKND